jgi:hypothetical protein
MSTASRTQARRSHGRFAPNSGPPPNDPDPDPSASGAPLFPNHKGSKKPLQVTDEQWKLLHGSLLKKEAVSVRAQIERTGLHHEMISNVRHAVVEKLFEWFGNEFELLTRSLDIEKNHRNAEVYDVRGKEWDETPCECAVQFEEGGQTYAYVAAVMRSNLQFCVLVNARVPAGAELPDLVIDERDRVSFYICGRPPSHLCALRDQRGSTMRVGLRRVAQLRRHVLLSIVSEETFDVSTADEAGANENVIRDAEVTDAPISQLRGPCGLHHAQHVKGEGPSVRPRLIPRLVQAIKSLELTGLVYKFRQEIDYYFEQKVQVRRGSSTEPARRHREAVVDLIWPADDRRRNNVVGRVSLKRLPNGDWGVKYEVTHHCAGESCCPGGRAQTVKKFQKYITYSILPRRVVRIAQHRWAGLEEGLRFLARLYAPHGILEAVYPKLFKDIVDSGALDGINLYDLEMPQQESASTDQTPSQILKSAQLIDQRRDNEKAVESTKEWIKQTLGPDVLLGAITYEPVRLDFDERAKEGGRSWQMDHNLAGARGEEREFRVTNAAKGKHVNLFLQRVSSLVRESAETDKFLPYTAEVGNTEAAAFEAFKICARLIAATFLREFEPRFVFPLKTFRMLPEGSNSVEEQEQVVDEFLDVDEHVLGHWAALFRARAQSQTVPGSSPCIPQKLIMLAIIFARAIGSTESGHAANRRRSIQCGTQGPKYSLSSLSADENLRWLRGEASEVMLADLFVNPKYAGLDDGSQPEVEALPGKPRRTGGKKMAKIWAWRVFCYEQKANLQGGEREDYKQKAVHFGTAKWVLRRLGSHVSEWVRAWLQARLQSW